MTNYFGANKKIKISPDFITAIFFPITAIYFELIFKLIVGVPFLRPGTLVILAISAFTGGVVWIFNLNADFWTSASLPR